MARVAAGDRDALGTLVRRHRRRVYGIALALTGQPALAEDALQETFLAVLRGAAGFRGGSARAWMFTIARHQVARQLRRAAPVPTDDETLAGLAEAAGWGDDVERRVDAGRVRAALAALADSDREILVLHDVTGLTGDETAAVLGLGLAAMKSRLLRARLRLAARLHLVSGAPP